MERLGVLFTRISLGGLLPALFCLALLFLLPGPARADRVELVTGEVLVGKIVEDTPEKIVLEHDLLGRIEVPRSQVKTVTVPGPEPRIKIKNQLDAGVSGVHGNAETFSLRSAFRSEAATGGLTLKFAAAYYYASTDNKIKRHEYFFEIFDEYFFRDGPVSVFTQGRYDWNAFEAWEGRVALSAGVGWKIVDAPELRTILRVGGGARRSYGVDENAWNGEGLVNLEAKWTISPSQTVIANSVYLRDFSTAGEYRILSSAAWTAKLNTAGGLHLKAGAEHEHQSKVEPGYKYNNLKYYGAIALEF